MDMQLVCGYDAAMADVYKIARVIYAETGASSLPAVEALAAMINNAARARGVDASQIVDDAQMFESLNVTSGRHKLLAVDADNRALKMCVRVVQKMRRGNLPDTVFGAVMFHRADVLPEWALARGYIADVDGLLFYLNDLGA